MLELRPICENCAEVLPPASADAMICSFECTFCAACVEGVLHNVCPNCGGGFQPRPIRPARKWRGEAYLGKHPPTEQRKHRPVDVQVHEAFAASLSKDRSKRPVSGNRQCPHSMQQWWRIPADREAIGNVLRAYNQSKAGINISVPFVIRLRDDDGKVVGGLWGRTTYEWLFVEWLVVPEQLRGQGLGLQMMQKAEAEARSRKCIGMWLDTFEFQARGFYEKLGFSVIGQVEDLPRGSRRDFMQKRLDK